MTDNIDEEHLENPTSHQSENVPDKIIPNVDSATTNPNQHTENMEVHHHPQLQHKPKRWKEYFLEFLMIFLAVTLGFFAENVRADYIENVQEKEYAQSLYDDLKIDTATIQITYNEKEWIRLKFDTAKTILETNDLINHNEFIYYIERYLTYNDIFSAQDVTYQQLKSSGNFRYFKNISLYKNIADYYNLYSRYQSIDGSFGVINQNEISQIEAKLFNLKDLTLLDNENATTFYTLALPSEKKLAPIANDTIAQKLLYIKIANEYKRAYSAKIFLNWLKLKATNLIEELKKEYDLK